MQHIPLRLVVGGGRCTGFPKLKEWDISVNIAAAARPHVQGDVAWLPFADEVFIEVFFEYVPYSAFTGTKIRAISESARVLYPGGRLVIHTGNSVNENEVTQEMYVAGFRYIRVTNRGYIRFTGRLPGA